MATVGTIFGLILIGLIVGFKFGYRFGWDARDIAQQARKRGGA